MKPTPAWEHERAQLYLGDALMTLEALDAFRFDAIVTDPPYCSGAVSETSRVQAPGQGRRSETLRRFPWFRGDNMGTAGLAWLLRAAANVITCRRVRRSESEHQTQKPVELMAQLVNVVAPVGGLVCDPFAGSGTTGVAALSIGRRFVGIESELEHLQTARDRLDAEISQRRFAT